MERVTQETVSYEDRQFIVKKMNPLEGIAVLKELLVKAMPFDLFSFLSEEGGESEKIMSLLSNFSKGAKKEMSIDEFVAFEKRLLKNVSEVLKLGEVKILDAAGNYAVNDLENNMFLNGYLLLKVIEVNYKDFFLELLQKLSLLEGGQEIANKTMQVMNSVK